VLFGGGTRELCAVRKSKQWGIGLVGIGIFLVAGGGGWLAGGRHLGRIDLIGGEFGGV